MRRCKTPPSAGHADADLHQPPGRLAAVDVQLQLLAQLQQHVLDCLAAAGGRLQPPAGRPQACAGSLRYPALALLQNLSLFAVTGLPDQQAYGQHMLPALPDKLHEQPSSGRSGAKLVAAGHPEPLLWPQHLPAACGTPDQTPLPWQVLMPERLPQMTAAAGCSPELLEGGPGLCTSAPPALAYQISGSHATLGCSTVEQAGGACRASQHSPAQRAMVPRAVSDMQQSCGRQLSVWQSSHCMALEGPALAA